MPVPYTFATATGNIPLSHLDANFSNVSAYTSTAGTVTASAQPNVTSVGTLVALSVTGNVTAARYFGDGGNLTGITATAVNANNLLGTTLAANIVTSSLTAVGTLGSLTVTDTITGGNLSISGSVTGNGYRLTSINASNVTGTVATATTAGTVTTAAQPNITSVGNLSSLTASGNVTTGAYFIGDGSQLTNLPASSYSNSAVSAYLASGTDTANIITTGNVSGGNIIGNIVSPGTNQDVVFNRNGKLSTANGFNYNYAGNILYAPAGSFSGDTTTGVNGLFAGVGSFTDLGSDIMGQFTGNVNAYSQINFQNVNNGSEASGDYIVTADNGTDSTNFVDLGIGSSTYAPVAYPAYGPNDSYLLNNGGNLLINSQTAGKVIKVIVGGVANSNIITTISTSGIDVTGNVVASGNISANSLTANSLVNGTSNIAIASSGNINIAIGASPMIQITTTANAEATPRGLVVEGFVWAKSNGVGQSGNVIGGNLKTTGLVTASGNITGGNVLTSGLISATGDVTANGFIGSSGTFRLSNLTTAQIANIIASNGDMVYNTTENKIQAYVNGAWGNVTVS